MGACCRDSPLDCCANSRQAAAKKAASHLALSLNYEARKETQRHYNHYQCSYGQDGRLIVQQGYINPRLDILHIMEFSASSALMRSDLTLGFRGLKEALLHITLSSCDLDGLVRALHARGLLRLIKTIDFWVSKPTSDMLRDSDEIPAFSYRRADGSLVRPVAPASAMQDLRSAADCNKNRYRICRTPPSDGPILVEWEDAAFYPAVEDPSAAGANGSRCLDCSRLSNHTPTFWRWQYRPEASVPTADIALNFSTNWQPPNPNTATELRAPAAVSHWFDRDARRVLRKRGVLQFDRHRFQQDTDTQTSQGEGWSVFMVVSPNHVYHREAIAHAFKDLHDARAAVKSAHAIQDGFFSRVVPKLKQIASLQTVTVHGVCAPGYLNENEIAGWDGQEERYDTPGNSGLRHPMHSSLIGNSGFPLVSNGLVTHGFSGDSMAAEAADRIFVPHEVQLARGENRLLVDRKWHQCVKHGTLTA
ncbi:hypothetical protein QBC40DRAFT_316662 [Triangularia verruculosa]|uniref:Uncharacterized protein n=1 Tax=Triangularia verruculosa TaxID=2587418 RepID=A0AAN6X7B5_9PEZI|nr:hypothetical protein QBC40DRAFT_316662 [Triangularia verruculosa]